MPLNLFLIYSGRLPNYFRLYLESVRHNPTIRWTIICDLEPDFELPCNVRWVRFTLGEFAERVRERLGLEPMLRTAYKLCDFKPTLGMLYPELISGFDYWGHCDPDIIWGDLRRFIDDQLRLGLLKFQMSGAFSLYRNCKLGNSLFMMDHPIVSYQRVLESDRNFSFDEWPGLARLLRRHGVPWDNRTYMAEIQVGKHDLRLEWGGQNRYPQVFEWNAGRLFRVSWRGSEELRDEFAYIHLQKRRFLPIQTAMRRFAIVPGRFVEIAAEHDLLAAARLNRRSVLRDAAFALGRPWRYWRARRRFDRSLMSAHEPESM